jgi:phage shock protein C
MIMETPSKKLYRSRSNRIIAGVCAGLGEFFAIDPTVVRLIFVLGMIFGFGSFAFAYLVMIFVVPEEPVAGA